MTPAVLSLSRYATHRQFCTRTYMPGDENNAPGPCDCGLDAVLASLVCTCGHAVNRHTDREVSDVVGWPCIDCASERCRGFALAAPRAAALSGVREGAASEPDAVIEAEDATGHAIFRAQLEHDAKANPMTRDYLSSSEQKRLVCTCGHTFIRHSEYGCWDCGTAQRTTAQHSFTRVYAQGGQE